MEIKYYLYNHWAVLRDQPYGVVIEPLIRGSVDAVRQHCPAKRLTPMGLFATDDVCGRDCGAGGASFDGRYLRHWSWEIGKFAPAFGVYLVQEVRIEGVTCGGRR